MKDSLFYSRNSGRHTLLLVSLIILIVIVCFSSFIRYSTVVIVPIWALWLVYLMSSKMGLSKDEKSFVTVSFILMAFILFYKLIGYSSTTTLGLLVNLNWIMAGVVSVYVLKLFTGRELSIVYRVFFISLLVLMLLLLKMGGTLIAMGDVDEAIGVSNTWVGSVLMLITGVCLIVFLNVRTLLIRIIAIALLLLTIYINIVILQRGTNVIFTLAEISVILVFLIKRKSVVIVLAVLIVAFMVVIEASDNLISFFDWLAYVSPSERLSKRFSDISLVLTFESLDASEGSFGARNELLRVSWNTFTSSFGHFLFGTGDHYDLAIIGRHSFFVDSLARYGIIGGGLLFVYFKKQYQIMMSCFDSNREWALYMQCATVFLFYILRNFYGQVAYTLVNLVILLFFPLTFQIIQYYKQKNII